MNNESYFVIKETTNKTKRNNEIETQKQILLIATQAIECVKIFVFIDF